jgi:hypothetical protein
MGRLAEADDAGIDKRVAYRSEVGVIGSRVGRREFDTAALKSFSEFVGRGVVGRCRFDRRCIVRHWWCV